MVSEKVLELFYVAVLLEPRMPFKDQNIFVISQIIEVLSNETFGEECTVPYIVNNVQ